MAAYFLNTSAVVKRYIKETGSAWVRALADPLAAHLIYLARITDVEATSAVIRRQRGGTISPAAAAMLRQFRQDQALGYRIIDTDDGLAYAQFLSGLETLGLNETHITDESLKRIRQSTTIRVLSLKYTQVTDKGMIYLSHLSSLNELHLDVTGVGDSGIAHLGRLPKLEQFTLSHTNITDASIAYLKGLRSIRKLDLSWTKISDHAVRELRKALPALTVVR